MPTGSTRVVGVIGDPVRHSLSPQIHNAAFAAAGLDWVYVAFEVPAGSGAEAVGAMAVLGIEGFSVTMPHKEDVAAACTELSADARALAAVNCVVRRNGRSIGHSTDGEGFLFGLHRDLGFDPMGANCVVLGAGGAARAVVLALAGAGAASVGVVNRTQARGIRAAELAGSAGALVEPSVAADADLIINATPMGMGADTSLPIDPSLIGAGQCVVDLIYHPAETPLLVAAASNGARTANGLSMLVGQAATAFTLWTGEQAPVDAMFAAVNSA